MAYELDSPLAPATPDSEPRFASPPVRLIDQFGSPYVSPMFRASPMATSWTPWAAGSPVGSDDDGMRLEESGLWQKTVSLQQRLMDAETDAPSPSCASSGDERATADHVSASPTPARGQVLLRCGHYTSPCPVELDVDGPPRTPPRPRAPNERERDDDATAGCCSPCSTDHAEAPTGGEANDREWGLFGCLSAGATRASASRRAARGSSRAPAAYS